MKCSSTDCPNNSENGFKTCERCRKRARDWADLNRDKVRSKGQKIYIALKKQVMEAYGGCKCLCCGETHLEFLSIDHIDGNGAEHRKEITGDARNGKNFYYWLRDNDFPPGFRVLCLNCNFALGHHGKCPHNNGLTQAHRSGRPRKNVPTETVNVQTE